VLLARQMLSLLQEGAKKSNQAALNRLDVMPRWKEYSQKFRNALDNFEMFVFEPSALVPVSDMRTDTLRGLSGITTHVTRQPKKLFFDADTNDLFGIMPHLRPEGIGAEGLMPSRRGAFLEIEGEGRCTVQSIANIPAFTKKFFRTRSFSVEQAHFLTMFLNLQISQMRAQIDTGTPLKMSSDEFLAVLSPRTPKSKVGELWSEYELRHYFSSGLDPDLTRTRDNVVQKGNRSVSEWHQIWEGELNGIFQTSLAMTAALELKDTEVRFKALEKRGAGSSRKQQEAAEDEVENRPLGLSVVTMHLLEDILLSAYEPSLRQARGPETGQGSARALHYVRGHMFLARNGQIVYRHPHFRGQAGLRKVTRVVA
jgi:hypothetical protein